MTTPATPNVLAQRYASPEMVAIWSAENKIIAERRLWLAVLRAQRDLGLEVPDGAFAAYEAVIDDVNLGSIAARERVTRHDVKARIEEFNALAGYEQIHKGMTSRDLTENIEQVQISRLPPAGPRPHAWPCLAALGRRAAEFADLVMAGRTHNVPAQATTLGKRFASAADEVLQAYQRISESAGAVSVARHQGAGRHRRTCSTCWARPTAVAALETAVAQEISGSARLLTSVGQVYPRSLDYEVVSALVQLAAGPSVAGDDDPVDGRCRTGDRGLPAGPGGLVRHAAQDECPQLRAGLRSRGRPARLRLAMTGELAGAQWNEGDVFCSVIRRVALPDAFYAIDGLFETFLTVLEDFGAYPAVIERELERYRRSWAARRY